MKPWQWLLLLAFGAASAAGGPNDKPAPNDEQDDVTTPKKRLYAMLKALPMLTEDQRLFIMLVAYGETAGTWRPSAHNDTPSEVAASRRALDDNPQLAQRLLACNAGGLEAWAIGSGGYGGRLVPYFGDDMLDVGLPCSPRGVFDPTLSLVSTILTAWKLQQTPFWARGPKTVASLRVGYYGIGYMDDVPSDRREKYIRHARAVGLPEGFVDQVLPEFPGPEASRQIFSELATRPA